MKRGSTAKECIILCVCLVDNNSLVVYREYPGNSTKNNINLIQQSGARNANVTCSTKLKNGNEIRIKANVNNENVIQNNMSIIQII